MSSSRNRTWAGCCAALALAALLGGCGFQPLYGTANSGESAEGQEGTIFAELETIQISPLKNQAGQQLHNLLRDRINPHGQPENPKYLLSVGLRQEKEDLAIREDETATRASLTLRASYSLVSTESDEVVFRGRSSSTNSYNVVGSAFATFTSAQDARERGLRELSEDIRLRLAAFFARREAAAGS